MKKVYSLGVLFVLVLILAINFAFAQSIVPGSADATGKAKNDFAVTDEIYAKSEAICGVNKTVNLYILDDKDKWGVGDGLVDVRGAPQNITTDAQANLPLTKIWEKPTAGKYDIIIDCNNDGKYDYPIDPIDAFPFTETGFKVTAPAGTGKASLGKSDIGDHLWQYDPETKNLLNEMIQFSLLAIGEDIILQNITLKSSIIENISTEKIEVYVDKNNNGKKDAEDIKIGESSYAGGVATSRLEYSLPENVSTNFLVAYIMKPEAKGNLSFSILSIYGKGKNSAEIIKFSGLPLNSGTKKISAEKACTGTLTLVFPSSVKASAKVTAQMNNLTNCVGREIKLQPNPCTSLEKTLTCSCISGATGCSCDFTATKNKTYWACIDKNNDTDMIDFGESAYTNLVVSEAEEQPKATATATATPSPSETIKLGEETVSAKLSTSTFFLVMEITLVLILFMLFLILVSLRKGKKANNK